MAIKIGINGFGRIGRVVLRILAEDPEQYEICGINLRKADVDYMVYLLKYDSVFRNFNGTVEHEGGDLVVNGHKIKVFSQSDAAMIPWHECGAEYIIESTGANNTTEKASRHFKDSDGDDRYGELTSIGTIETARKYFGEQGTPMEYLA